jgi:tryptophan halogenase
MTDAQIKRVVIVGGGTAGWLCAAALARVIGQVLDIVLIESDEIGTVGVGEATVPAFISFLELLTLDVDEVIKAAQGSFKLGIRFQDWYEKGRHYDHVFGSMGAPIGLLPFYQYWLRQHLQGKGGSLWDYSLNARAIGKNRFARMDRIPNTQMEGLVYALHFDAGMLARYLRERCETAGVVRREGRVDGVNLRAADGFIESVTLRGGEVIEGDMFVDCSGFQGLLIEGALKTGFDDWTHWLPCDRAIAVACEPAADLAPYTQATALTAGWQWRIPLQHRLGNGHVFCSAWQDEDEARRMLLGNLDGAPISDPRTLKFTTGKRKTFWNRNCLALGLAGGFMEPLESTSILLIQTGIIRFLKLFPDMSFSPLAIEEYNRQTTRDYELVRDFLVLHYKANRRDDSDFWRHCREMDVPDSLAYKMDYFRAFGRLSLENDELFGEASWLQVLLGQGVVPRTAPPLTAGAHPDRLEAFMAGLDGIYSRAVAGLPAHATYVDRHCRAEARSSI